MFWARLRRRLTAWLFRKAAKHVCQAHRLGTLADEAAAHMLGLPAQGLADELKRDLERIMTFGSGALREAARAQWWLHRARRVGGLVDEPAAGRSVIPLVPLEEGQTGHRPALVAPATDRIVFH